ncbi:hypothetical protein MXB_1942 [Myxobolus squamalis]|nr:hypothetical protein MXB_1942 [Myxobolus squamalis]
MIFKQFTNFKLKNILRTGKTPKSIEDCKMYQLLGKIDKYPCLKKPIAIKRLFSTCGDGVIDEGEDCDCAFGGNKLCNILSGDNKCCNMDTCKFSNKTFKCSRGQCCDQCQNKMCRASLGNCDMPEYCNGTYNEV